MNRADGPEDRSLTERCLGSTLPNLGERDYFQIGQSPGYVTIYYEHGQGGGGNRIIPVDGSSHLPGSLRLWLGDARGRWEGDTLIVDTTNFTAKTNSRGSRENLHLVERFRRVDANTLDFEITIEDPTTWTRPWTVVNTFTKNDDREKPDLRVDVPRRQCRFDRASSPTHARPTKPLPKAEVRIPPPCVSGAGEVDDSGLFVAHELFGFVHHLGRADEERRALVQRCWRELENSLVSVGRFAARLFDDESKGVGLVEKTQFSIWRFGGRRVNEDAAFEEIAMEVGDERANVA